MKGKGLFSTVLAVVAVSFILGSGLPCFSQPPGEGGPGGPDSSAFGGDEPPPSFEKREEIRKRIELIRMWKLTEELDLTEETGAKLFPLLHKYDEKRTELHKERRGLINQLGKALENEATSDETIEGVLEKLNKAALAELDLMRQQREELKGILSPRQQAKFILFQREFHRDVRRIIAEARERKMRKWRHDRPRGD